MCAHSVPELCVLSGTSGRRGKNNASDLTQWRRKKDRYDEIVPSCSMRDSDDYATNARRLFNVSVISFMWTPRSEKQNSPRPHEKLNAVGFRTYLLFVGLNEVGTECMCVNSPAVIFSHFLTQFPVHSSIRALLIQNKVCLRRLPVYLGLPFQSSSSPGRFGLFLALC